METKKLEKANVEERFIQKINETKSLTIQEKALARYYFQVANNVFDSVNKKLKKDMPAISWQNVEFENFVKQMLIRLKLGINPILPNMTNIIPYFNNNTKKYDLVFVDGYKGLEYMAKKFAIDFPKNIIFELIYETDIFVVYKKDYENNIEKYKFEITNPLDRGEVVGGFYYMEYEDPTKNKLVFFNKKQLEKRKPKYASVEFWGGERDKWENGKIVGKEYVEGWYEEMLLKTLKRHCYNSFLLDINNIKQDDEFVAVVSNNNTLQKIEADEANVIEDTNSKQEIEQEVALETNDEKKIEKTKKIDSEKLF
jgi:recombination protein RecT